MTIVKTECPTDNVIPHSSVARTGLAEVKMEPCWEDYYGIDIHEESSAVFKTERQLKVEPSSPPGCFSDTIERGNETGESNEASSLVQCECDVQDKTGKTSVSQPKYHECSMCKAKFTRARSLRDHRARMHPSDQPEFECDHCGYRYRLKRDIARHMRRNHLAQRLSCIYCGKRVIYLDTHEQRCRAGSDNATFIHHCRTCGRIFDDESLLANHVLAHVRQNCSTCDICGHVAKDPQRLLRHKRRVHPPVKLMVPCPVCKKSFTKNNLYQHVLVHSGLRPFKCDVCGCTFVQRSTFINHRRQKHKGPLPPVKPVSVANLANEFMRQFSKDQ